MGPRRRRLVRLGAGLLALVGLTAGALALALRVRPSLERYAAHVGLPAPSPGRPGAGLRVTFLGTTTLLFDDGETAFMTDGFLERPGLLAVALRRLEPDPARLDALLQRAGVRQLAAVVPIHSHYDHALDAPYVAQKTGAVLYGSRSTVMIGRGAGLPEARLREVHDGEQVRFGRFTLTFVASEHSPHAQFPGAIDAPLAQPARARDYRMGECWSLLVDHDDEHDDAHDDGHDDGRRHTLLVHGSAGFRPGALAGRHAEVVFLGAGTLGKQPPDFRRAYLRETVEAVGARRAILVHWDDFFRPLDEPLVPLPYLLDDLPKALDELLAYGAAHHLDVRLPEAFQPADVFAP